MPVVEVERERRARRLEISGVADAPEMEPLAVSELIHGVEVSRARTYVDRRRALVIGYDRETPAGALGYAVALNPGYAVGDHFHHRREERILLLSGEAEFRLFDMRLESPTFGRLCCFAVQDPGTSVRIPAEVGHAILAHRTPVVLQVLASCDFDPEDDVPVDLSAQPGGPVRPHPVRFPNLVLSYELPEGGPMPNYSDQLLGLFRECEHAGKVEGATHYGQAGIVGMGPFLQVWLRVEEPGRSDGVVESWSAGIDGDEDGAEDEDAFPPRPSPLGPRPYVAEARFKSYGCPAAIAVGEAFCRLIEGRTVDEALAITAEDVAAALGGVPEGKEHCPPLPVTAFAARTELHHGDPGATRSGAGTESTEPANVKRQGSNVKT